MGHKTIAVQHQYRQLEGTESEWTEGLGVIGTTFLEGEAQERRARRE